MAESRPVRVHLVDGTFELFRAHYARRPPFSDRTGRSLKATVGVVQSLLQLVKERGEAVTHLAVAFDNPIVSFRNRLFPLYKTDEGIDPELRGQFDDVEVAVAAMGITVWRMVEFEADDALATAAVALAARPEVDQVRILTPDKDLGQVLSGQRVVQLDRIRKKLITEADLRAARGFGPQSVPDFLALVGDTADGIPGLRGWGERSAAQVLSVYPHLEDIPGDPLRWRVSVRSAPALSAVLEASRADAALYRTLATLRRDVPLDLDLGRLAFTGLPPAFLEWCAALGFTPPAGPPR